MQGIYNKNDLKWYNANFFGTYLKMVLLRNSTMQGGVMQGLPV